MLRFDQIKPIIGMIHLPPLPGSPRSHNMISEITAYAMRDAEALMAGGVDALMIENYGDSPFYPRRVPAITVASFTRVATEIRQRFDGTLGINVLRNDGQSALAIAAAVDAEFIRVNVLCGAQLTDQGVIQGIAHELLRLRQALCADHIQVLADVDVKHSAPLAPRPISEDVSDTISRGGADAIVISGTGTGVGASLAVLEEAKRTAGSAPVLVGSGVTEETIGALAEHSDGFIVGSALKQQGLADNPVELARVEALVRSLRNNV